MAVNRRQNGSEAVDQISRRLLAELQEDGRLSLAELGRRVGLSAPAVAERLQRLEEDGVVAGYRALVNPRALGLGLSAVVRVRPNARQLPKVHQRERWFPRPSCWPCRRAASPESKS